MSKPTTNEAKPSKEGGSFLAEIRGSAAANSEGTPPPKPSRRLSSSYLIAAVMVALSAGALFGMRTYGKKAGLKLEKFEADYKPAKSETATAAQTQKVLAELEAHGTPLQISADAIPRNPFLMSAVVPVIATPDGPSKSDLAAKRRAEEAAAREQRDREAAFADTLKGLEVSAVIMGQRPVARVSGKLYRIGDTVAKIFTVLEINERGVKLGFEGREFELVIKKSLNPDGTKPDEAPANQPPFPR